MEKDRAKEICDKEIVRQIHEIYDNYYPPFVVRKHKLKLEGCDVYYPQPIQQGLTIGFPRLFLVKEGKVIKHTVFYDIEKFWYEEDDE